MGRLVFRNDHNQAYITDDCKDVTGTFNPQIALNKLCSYEETGLSPFEVQVMLTTLNDYKQKIADGRLVEMYKEVFYIENGKIKRMLPDVADEHGLYVSLEFDCGVHRKDIGKTVFVGNTAEQDAKDALRKLNQ